MSPREFARKIRRSDRPRPAEARDSHSYLLPVRSPPDAPRQDWPAASRAPGLSGDRLRQAVFPGILLVGDTVMAAASICGAWWLRYHTQLNAVGKSVVNANFADYFPLILLGLGLLIATFAHLDLYSERLLLRPLRSMAVITKGTSFWLVAYLGVTLVLEFNPPISRLFVVAAAVAILLTNLGWRALFYRLVAHGPAIERIQQRVAILGWNDEAQRLVTELEARPLHPYKIVGIILNPESKRQAAASLPVPVLGKLSELESALRANRVHVLIASDLQYSAPTLRCIMESCERTYTAFKIVPSIFDVFISGLRMQTIGDVPILGVEELAINKLLGRVLKRTLDILAALCGLVLSAPIIALGAILIKIESPGPVFFGQKRVGAGHQTFMMWKLRSMRLDAAARDHLSVSTSKEDPRLLRVGRVLRRWNLDELPQFWNVLVGDMSLVGPRPERPFHVARLSAEIPHYLPRHLVRPGLTGLAQVSGLRGGTDIAKRIECDISYIENWSIWLDIQVAILTLFRWRDPTG